MAFLKDQLKQFTQNGPPQGDKGSGGSEVITRETVKGFVSNPAALDSFTIVRLQDLRVIVKGQLATSERDLTDREKEYLNKLNDPELELQLSTPVLGEIFKSWLPETPKKKQEFIDQLKVLLDLIENKLTRRDEVPEPPQIENVPTDVQQRERLLEKMESLRAQRNSHRSKMQLGGASEDEIRRFENLFDNALHDCEVELQKLLST